MVKGLVGHEMPICGARHSKCKAIRCNLASPHISPNTWQCELLVLRHGAPRLAEGGFSRLSCIMADRTFEYDVAFSFTAQDEAIATELNDLLAGRLKTFIYSERQRDIAGRDGQEAFSETYAKKARVVVVIFRQSWGQTPWTRVEMDAIKNRSLEDGWDFTVFVPIEDRPILPPWLPKTRLYVGLERWGAQGAAAVIEARATERGAEAHQETVADRAARFARSEALKVKQSQFLKSDMGVNAARAAYESVKEALNSQINKLPALGIGFADKGDFAVVRGRKGINLIVSWWVRYSNSLENVYLEAKFYKGFPDMPGYMPSFEKAVMRQSRKFSYCLVRENSTMYVEVGAKKNQEFSPEYLADQLIMNLLDVIDKERGD